MRCNKCEAKKKRSQRLRKAISRVFGMSTGIGQFHDIYNYPKLITFALMNDYYQTEEPWIIREKLTEELNKQLPTALKRLQKKGTLGGTFVLECSTKLVWTSRS